MVEEGGWVGRVQRYEDRRQTGWNMLEVQHAECERGGGKVATLTGRIRRYSTSNPADVQKKRERGRGKRKMRKGAESKKYNTYSNNENARTRI